MYVWWVGVGKEFETGGSDSQNNSQVRIADSK
jgi:hypothetical protein